MLRTCRPPALAFTLIELLVVITIIVVLLALLTPALDKAIYQAELTVCSANHKGIANAANIYTGDHNRHYPDRLAVSGLHAPLLRSNGAGIDDRPMLQPYMPLNKVANDPLARPIEIEEARNDLVYASISLWFGWQWYSDTHGRGKRMAKLGDRFTWNGDADEGVRTFRFDILTGDFMRVRGGLFSSHPDDAGLLHNEYFDDDSQSVVYSYWVTYAGQRGGIDYNLARADGSVERHRQVNSRDERMVEVPEYNFGAPSNNLYHQLPRR